MIILSAAQHLCDAGYYQMNGATIVFQDISLSWGVLRTVRFEP
jgi:hypothetical protein